MSTIVAETAAVKELIGQAVKEAVLGMAPESPAEVLTVDGAAQLLCVSIPTVHRWCREESLPYHRAGDHKRFLRTELLDWLKGRPQ